MTEIKRKIQTKSGIELPCMRITRAGSIVERDELVNILKNPQDVYYIENCFRIREALQRGKTQYAKYLNLVFRSGKFTIFPRFAAFDLLQKGIVQIKNKITHGCVLSPDRKFEIILTQNQATIINWLLSYIYTEQKYYSGAAGCVLELGTGQGKTYLAAGLINALGVKTLYVVPSEFLLRQSVRVFETAFPTLTIGQYYGKRKTDGDIVVALINSILPNCYLYKSKRESTIKDKDENKNKDENKDKDENKNADYTLDSDTIARFGIVIYDEVHKYCTDNYIKTMYHAQAPCVMGMSATTRDRIDEFDAAALMCLGPRVEAVLIPGFDAKLSAFQYNVTVVKYAGPPTHTATKMRGEQLDLVEMMYAIESDPYRETIILSYVLSKFRSGRNILILSEHCVHVTRLARLLAQLLTNDELDRLGYYDEETGKITTEKVQYLMGGVTEEQITAVENKGQIIISTYGYSKEGVSIDRLDTLIKATPRRTGGKQIDGRIGRIGGNRDTIREIIDIVDINTIFKNQYYERRKSYIKNLSATIETIKINFSTVTPHTLNLN